MYLKSLELHGFKSFPDKTVLHFNSGSTIIVGPNGSGKSNLTDAMKWVLGELSSKSLRGSKMEDVIFSGADGVRPMGFAEVSVTFDNREEPRTIPSEYDEITVTRRYYRAGDSAYFINKKPVRLKDIVELFMNTGIGREGYSIIGQGKIAEIISKKSEDRRAIFEEAAGITKYRYKKNESAKKLAETENNMLRISDIASELESRIGPLEKDAAKAREYMDLFEQKKKVDISLWRYDIDRYRVELEKVQADTDLSEHEHAMAEDSQSQIDALLDASYEKASENREALQRVIDEISSEKDRRAKIENDVRISDNNVINAEKRIESEERNISLSLSELENTKEKLGKTKESKEKSLESRENAEKVLKELEEKRENEISQRDSCSEGIEELFAERQNLEKELGDVRVRLDVLKKTDSDEGNRKDSIEKEVSSNEKEIREMEEEIRSISETVSDYEKNISIEDEKYSEASEKFASEEEKKNSLAEELSSVNADTEALVSRISALEKMAEHFEGFSAGVRAVMKAASENRISGIISPISNLIRVDSKYMVAIDTAFGSAMQNIVASDEKAAKSAISYLKENNLGRATFYPLTTVSALPRTEEMKTASKCRGFVGYADELVKTDDKYRETVKSIVGRICVFDTLDNAVDGAKKVSWKVKFVTLDGQQINPGGSLTGGAARRDSGILSRNAQIENLKEELKKKEKKVLSLEKELSDLTSSVNALSLQMSDADEKRRLLSSLLSAEKISLGEVNARYELASDLVGKLRKDISDFDENNRKNAEEIVLLEAKAAEYEEKIASVVSERESLAQKRGEHDAEADVYSVRISDAKAALTGILKDIENCDAITLECTEKISLYEENVSSRKNEIDRLREEIKKAKEKAKALSEEGEEKNEAISSLEEKKRLLSVKADELEAESNTLRGKQKEISSKKEILFIALTKNQAKLEKINEDIEKMSSRLWDEYSLTYSSAVELAESEGYEAVTEKTRSASKHLFDELKGKIKALGNVNVNAIEEYASTKERYDYIKTQLDDLVSSKAELEKIIADIEKEMKVIFIDSFEKINKNFSEVFKDLFGGGEAELSLTEPDDVLSSGIEISAAPPGKTIKSLSLLSGGEQAFIAIALLFAIVRFNPSPFCIFDEIEAALDEVNVARVANYVKKFSKEMQIIMITHRRGTMDIADTLYGVTMPRRGVSKVFTLDVQAHDENSEYLK